MTAPVAERVNRFLARRGVSSRRGADQLIAAGRVTINGVVAEIGATVEAASDVVCIDGRVLEAARADSVTLMLNKPAGYVTTRRDPQHRPTVMELVAHHPGLVPVGRLDADTRGLLLLTTDGELAHRLTHPRFGIPKRYRVLTRSEASPEVLERLRSGVELDDGPACPLAVDEVTDARGAALDITMGEGRKREVRRLCAVVGVDLLDLQRVAYGPLTLGALAEGRSRPLRDPELTALHRAVGLEEQG